MSLWKQWVRERVMDPTEAQVGRRTATLLIVDIILGMALVWFNLMVQDLGYRVENTSKLIEKLDLEHAELVAEITRETSPERLRRRAQADLGLRLPAPGQVMAIDAQP